MNSEKLRRSYLKPSIRVIIPECKYGVLNDTLSLDVSDEDADFEAGSVDNSFDAVEEGSDLDLEETNN